MSTANNSAAVYFFFPETNGRHLEEVDQIFRDSKNIFEPVRMAKGLPHEAFEDHETPTGKASAESVEKAQKEA